nr:hypothetical protein [Actinomycetes bacterium]
PIQDEFTRAIMLSSLLEVDLVIVFAESTATSLIQAIQPDVYLKGGDYQRTPTEESEFVRSYGGSVEFIALADGYSTTATIARIKSLQE